MGRRGYDVISCWDEGATTSPNVVYPLALLLWLLFKLSGILSI